MISNPPYKVAIIGAGLSGLTLAISLHRQGISSHIYELRPPNTSTSGALMLSPNALRILDTLGLYDRLKVQGYSFETISYKNHNQVTTDKYYLGQEKLYGYKALRIYRQILLTELRAEVKNLEIPITYGMKFSHIVSESSTGVEFAFIDGTIAKADILIGADGIHSNVRKHIVPDVVPKYSGMVAITCALQRASLIYPEGTDASTYPMPVAIHGRTGAFVMAPQNVEGSEVLAGTQLAWPEQDRKGWDALLADRQGLLDLFRRGYEEWPEIVQSALDNVPLETLAIWPYYVVPKLESWFSGSKRAVIIGDAAHAIPPTAGQGASQGFEDAFTLSIVLANVGEQGGLEGALTKWMDMRQERVDKVIKLTLQLNNARLPQVEREKLARKGGIVWQSGDAGELGWLYSANVERDVFRAIGLTEMHKAVVNEKEKRMCPVDWARTQLQT